MGYSEKLTDMSEEIQAVLAVNGDSCSNNRHKDNGTIIRNGIIYRSQPTDAETCVLNYITKTHKSLKRKKYNGKQRFAVAKRGYA